MRVDVYHNILWSRYKAAVFSELWRQAVVAKINISFTQIAETEIDRVSLNAVDLSCHKYPYDLIYGGAYESISVWVRVRDLFVKVLKSDASVVVLPGFHLMEYWAMLIACIVSGKKRIVVCDSTAKDNPRVWWKSILKQVFFRACDGYFAYGVRAAEYLCENGANPSRVFSRCQAASLPDDYDSENVSSARAKLSSNVAFFNLLFVGRLSPEKRVVDLIHALSIVNIGGDKKFRLRIAGNGPDRQYLERKANEYGVADFVEFLGACQPNELANEYINADLLVLPSSREPWGLVVNEALAFGCPVVVSDACGCVPELVLPGETGYSYSSENVDELATVLLLAVKNLINTDKVTKRCIELAKQYTPEIAAKQMLGGIQLVGG